MPFPTTRHTLSDVGSARGQGPGGYPCVHPQVYCLLRRRQSTKRQVHLRHLAQVRCRYLRNVSEEAASPPAAQKENGGDTGQRPLSPRQTAQAFVEETSKAPRTTFSSAVQSPISSDRAGLEAGTSIGNTQSVLCQLGRSADSHRTLLQSVAKAQFSAAKAMRHYLRRYV